MPGRVVAHFPKVAGQGPTRQRASQENHAKRRTDETKMLQSAPETGSNKWTLGAGSEELRVGFYSGFNPHRSRARATIIDVAPSNPSRAVLSTMS